MGIGGVTPRTAKINIRNVHCWHFGKICPIESPEGDNVGLVLSYAAYVNINVDGQLLTAYYKIRDRLISNNIIYLNYYTEKHMLNPMLFNKNKSGKCITMVANSQMFSHVVNLIPFLNYNDATRVLMAANMLKQAVPLLLPQSPLIGTGEEYLIMKDMNVNIIARQLCIISAIDSSKIVVYEFVLECYYVYLIPVPRCTNQGGCSRFRVVVRVGQVLNKGEILAECQSSDNREISLGTNLLVAIACWNGFNYEDSILISENVVNTGIFHSLHVIELHVDLLDTNLGPEVLTNNLGKCSPELDSNGLVIEGAIVCEGDVLVGKLTPKASMKELNKFELIELSSEFRDYYNSSLVVPKGIKRAIVIDVFRDSDTSVYYNSAFDECTAILNFVRKEYFRKLCQLSKRGVIVTGDMKDVLSFDTDDKKILGDLNLLKRAYVFEIYLVLKMYVYQISIYLIHTERLRFNISGVRIIERIEIKLLICKSIQTGDKICGRHGNKGVISKIVPKQDMPFMADGTIVDVVINPLSIPSRMNIGQILETQFGLVSYKLGFEYKDLLSFYDYTSNKKLFNHLVIQKLLEVCPNINTCSLSFELLYKVATELADGVKLVCTSFETINNKQLNLLFKRINNPRKSNLYQLYDGRTGLPLDREVTVGKMYMLKLNHLVDDKIHARSVGPYSDIMKQPLRGKSNKGGQRLGEMEI